MAQFIGSTISLISRLDIRYIGKLENINTDEATVSLSGVRSLGTEGRKGDPSKEIPANDTVYEYIVFRASDVQDLKVEQAPAPEVPRPPPMPEDPAIMSTGQPPRPHGFQQGPPPPQNYPQQHHQHQQPPAGHAAMHSPWGPPPMGPGPYGGPPGAGPYGFMGLPPPGMMGGYPQPGPFAQQAAHNPFGAPPPQVQQQMQQQQSQQSQPAGNSQQQPTNQPQSSQAPAASATPKEQTAAASNVAAPAKPVQTTTNTVPSSKQLPTPATSSAAAQAPATAAKKAPDAAGRQQKPATTAQGAQPQAKAAPAPQPAEPKKPTSFASAVTSVRAPNGQAPATAGPVLAATRGDNVQQSAAAIHQLVKDVGSLNVQGGQPQQQRRNASNGTRGRGRGALQNGYGAPREKPAPGTDFDFQASNEKFQREKDSLAGKKADEEEDVVIPAAASSPDAFYDKKSSFFDNISSDLNGNKAGGFDRSAERSKNMDTFGQASVPGSRGGYRGRGRGYRGRGRGGYRSQQPAQ